MVFVHGAGGNLAAFDALAEALADGVRVVAFDQRGFGESDTAADLSLTAYVADLAAVIAATCDDVPYIYGQSFGACVALEYAARHECRGFINEDGPYCPPDEFYQRADVPVRTTSEVDAEHREQHFVGTTRELDDLISALGLTGTAFEPMLRRRMQRREDGRLESRPRPEELTRLVVEYQRHSMRLRQVFVSLAAPVLWLAASHDEYEQVKRECLESLVALQPTTQVEWLPTGHAVSLERPDLVADLVRSFVRKSQTTT